MSDVDSDITGFIFLYYLIGVIVFFGFWGTVIGIIISVVRQADRPYYGYGYGRVGYAVPCMSYTH